MKKILTVLTLAILAANLHAQAPQKLSYQSVIRNNSNALVTSTSVGIRISILQGSATGTEIYKEIYNPNPQTNANGLVTLEIGTGIPLTGTFAAIDWANGPYFIKTEADPLGGTTYSITGTSQLLSVPYALSASKADLAYNASLLDGKTGSYYSGKVIQAFSPACEAACPSLTTGSTTPVTINSISITVPGPGNIFVSFNGFVEAAGTGSLYIVSQIMDSQTGNAISYYTGGTAVRASLPSGYSTYQMNTSSTFSVSAAGTYTYYYRAAYFTATSSAGTFYSGNMSAIYTQN